MCYSEALHFEERTRKILFCCILQIGESKDDPYIEKLPIIDVICSVDNNHDMKIASKQLTEISTV